MVQAPFSAVENSKKTLPDHGATTVNSSVSVPTSFSGRDLLGALLVVFLWGSNFVAMKYGLKQLSPLQLGALRYLFTALPLVFFVKFPRNGARWVLLYGLTQGLGQFGFLFVALEVGMTASLASVLMQTQVFFTALFAYFILRERLNRAAQLGLICAAVGIACFAMNYVAPENLGDAGVSLTTPLGFVLSLCGAAMWAASNIVIRRAQRAMPEFEPLSLVVWAGAVPIVPFLALSAWFDPVQQQQQWLAISWHILLVGAYLGWAATVVGYALWTSLFKRYPANRVAPFSLGVPVVGLSAGVFVLGETITYWQWAGTVCVVLALAVVLMGPRLRFPRSTH